jgi:glycosyltransferase involved in cell wall biosynthesis
MPNILFIATQNNAVTHIRMGMFAQRMSELGLAHSRLFPEFKAKEHGTLFWEGELKKYLPQVEEQVKWSDFVVVQYVSSAEGVSLVEGIRDLKPCFMECDDYFSAIPTYSYAFMTGNKPGERQDYWGIRQAMESTGCIVSTQYLAEMLGKYNPNVHVIPNCIDFRVWNHYEPPKNERVRIGWVGGGNHDGDLKLIKPVLYDLVDEFPNIEVIIFCGMPLKWQTHDRISTRLVSVPILEYPEQVKKMRFDIGVAPLRDNYMNRGKSNLRYLEYSSLKIPTVASEVEPFKHDFVGLLASDEMDWYEHLSTLIKDEAYRKELGQKAYDSIYQNFNLDNISKKYSA